jgi:hypothetical protein
VARQEADRPIAVVQRIHQRSPPVRLPVNLLAVDPARMAVTHQIILDPAHETAVRIVTVGNEQLHATIRHPSKHIVADMAPTGNATLRERPPKVA